MSFVFIFYTLSPLGFVCIFSLYVQLFCLLQCLPAIGFTAIVKQFNELVE
jgi:hypothetical protein